MKFLGYIFRNARRNPVRSLLTVASIAVCLFLVMILASYVQINDDIASMTKDSGRLLSMSAQGFAQPVPIARVGEIAAVAGVEAASPFSWYGGKYQEEISPFAQFGVDADTVFTILNELEVPPDQQKAFREDRAGALIGRKLAEDRKLKLGDPLPLDGDVYPFDLRLTVRAIYEAPAKSDQRMCLFHWELLDEGLKRDFQGRGAGNAGTVYIKLKPDADPAAVSKKIDDMYRNSDSPTKTQTEEAFIRMFSEMIGDLKWYIVMVGMAVVFSLTCVAGVAMAMSMRERVSEVAVLKAIGFRKGQVLFLVLAEAILIAGLGGLLGTLGARGLFESIDMGKYSAGFLPFFYIPWSIVVGGIIASLGIGLAGGVIPAVLAARTSVVDGLRKVV
jgi:putative ABC transport system permease protein